MPFIERSSTISPDSPFVAGRIDRVVQELAGGVSRSFVTGLFDAACVKLNGRMTKDPWRRLLAEDLVEIRFEANRKYSPKPPPRQHRGFSIIFEDDDLIVVDKSPELLTVPTDRGERYTLVERVFEYVRRGRGGRGAFAVHRLDRGVSGLLVLGKSKPIVQKLRDQFAARKPNRVYMAVVAGKVEPEKGEIQTLLATDKSLKRFSTDNAKIGQLAITHYQVIEYLRDSTLLHIELETGRRNQIRVHFSEMGHPVIGDPRYEPELAAHSQWKYKRMALHARTLGFVHPVSGRTMSFDSNLPPEMIRFITSQQES